MEKGRILDSCEHGPSKRPMFRDARYTVSEFTGTVYRASLNMGRLDASELDDLVGHDGARVVDDGVGVDEPEQRLGRETAVRLSGQVPVDERVLDVVEPRPRAPVEQRQRVAQPLGERHSLRVGAGGQRERHEARQSRHPPQPRLHLRLQSAIARPCKMGFLTVPTVTKLEFQKHNMADGRHFENR